MRDWQLVALFWLAQLAVILLGVYYSSLPSRHGPLARQEIGRFDCDTSFYAARGRGC